MVLRYAVFERAARFPRWLGSGLPPACHKARRGKAGYLTGWSGLAGLAVSQHDTEADPAGSTSQTSSTSSTSPSKPPVEADNPAGNSGDSTAKAEKPMPLPLHEIEGNGGVFYNSNRTS